MPNVLVRDLPDDVHAGLQRRAQVAGQSLQQYLATELTRLAAMPSMDDVLARIARRSGGRVGLERAVADLDTERGDR
jgi:plasmid stability protein